MVKNIFAALAATACLTGGASVAQAGPVTDEEVRAFAVAGVEEALSVGFADPRADIAKKTWVFADANAHQDWIAALDRAEVFSYLTRTRRIMGAEADVRRSEILNKNAKGDGPREWTVRLPVTVALTDHAGTAYEPNIAVVRVVSAPDKELQNGIAIASIGMTRGE